MESNQSFKLKKIIKSFEEDLVRVSNPQGKRGGDPYGLFAFQLESVISTFSEVDITDLIEATKSTSSWSIDCDQICNKLNFSFVLTQTEKMTIYRVLVSLFASAASKKLIVFKADYCFNHLFYNSKPDRLLKKSFAFSFCFSRFALELVNVGTKARFDKVKELLKLDWVGVEKNHLNYKTWIKSTSDVFCYLCAYGIKEIEEITPETFNSYRHSRHE
ncbi:MAG: hypothetical protein QMC13_09770, partial [Colwellia sp.]